MGTGYTRADTANNIADGNIINASDLDSEYDAIQSAFNASTGHTHDGTTGEGAPIETIGPSQDVVATASVLRPKTDNTVDLGTTSLEYKDLFLDGTAHIDTLDVDENASITGTLGVTGAATLSSTLGVTGAATLSSTLGVTGAATLSSTLGVTGAATFSSTLAVTGATGIDGDFDINTNKFTVASATGNTAVAGTLGVTGATTLSSTLGVTGTTTLGTANITTGTITTADINGGNIDGTIIGATTAAAITGTTITGTTITGTSFVTSGDMTFGDNDKAIFGAGSDLQIYHNGSHSYIQDVGTGRLYITTNGDEIRLTPQSGGENGLRVQQDGAVNLYYDNAEKFSTTSTGIDVTGTVTADGLTVDGKIGFTSSVNGIINNPASLIINIDSDNNNTGEVFRVSKNDDNTAGTKLFQIAESGDISFYEDTGTTAKFFWDASAESLGIGTSSPDHLLSLEGDAPVLRIFDASNVLNQEQTIKFGTEPGNRTHAEISGVNLNTGNAEGALTFKVNSGASLSERMRIDSSGNLLVGGTTAATKVTLNKTGFLGSSTLGSATDSTFTIDVRGNLSTDIVDGEFLGGYLLDAYDSAAASGAGVSKFNGMHFVAGGNFGASASDVDLVFATGLNGNATERMRIDSSGTLLVGTISGATNSAGIKFYNAGGTLASSNWVKTLTGTHNAIRFYHNGSNVGNIQYSDTATSYLTSSDYRLKENVVELTDATDRLKQIPVHRFNFIADADTTVDGFLAHEVQSVVPEAITGTHNEVDADGKPVYQGIDQSKLVPLLVATIQELEARITALENA